MKGRLEVIAGPMYSGKSEELIRRLHRHEVAGRSVVAFKQAEDAKRYSKTDIQTHIGRNFPSNLVVTSSDLSTLVQELRPEVIGIEEVQFFDEDIVQVCKDLVRNDGRIVIAAGLRYNFRHEPFQFNRGKSGVNIGSLLAWADDITDLKAICTHKDGKNTCGATAEYTQRLMNGQPARRDSPDIVVGSIKPVGKEKFTYEARCTEHYVID